MIREDPNFHNLKILVCSSHGEEPLVERMGQLHINGYILKGKGMQNLVERTEQLIGLPEGTHTVLKDLDPAN